MARQADGKLEFSVILIAILIFAVIAGVAFGIMKAVEQFGPDPGYSYEPRQRRGPPALVSHDNRAQVWVLQKQEERRHNYLGVGERGGCVPSLKSHIETSYHFSLQAHDTRTAQPAWQRALLKVCQEQGGFNADAGLLGQDGEWVWLFLNDQPVALSASDGSARIDRAGLERINPALAGKFPNEIGGYDFLDGLIVTFADGQILRLQAPDFRAEVFTISPFERDIVSAGDRYETGASAPLTDWAWKSHLDAISKAGKHSAKFRSGFHVNDYILKDDFSGSTDKFAEGGFLIAANSIQPLQLDDVGDRLAIHREDGQLAISRLDGKFQQRWNRKLQLDDVNNSWQFDGHLLLFGPAITGAAMKKNEELLLAIDLGSGSVQSWKFSEHAGSSDGKTKTGR